MNPVTLGLKIQIARKKLQYSREYLASRCGISKEMLRSIEKGRRTPSLRILQELCDCLGLYLNVVSGK